jgi:RimJ/RimL family protein N-acetyltransferase
MQTPEKRWETERLVARPPTLADAQIVFEQYASDPAVARFTQWLPHRDVSETRGFIERCTRCWTDQSAFVWALWSKGDASFAGFLETCHDRTSATLGYALVRRHWHQGLMAEAVRPVVAWLLSQPEIYRVWAFCDLENTGSARVLEKVGMQREGVLRRWAVHPNVGDTPRDCVCFSIVKSAG